MIKVLSFLLLVTAVLAETERCDEETSLSSFSGTLREGQTIDEYCECMYRYYEGMEYFKNGTSFECKENPELAKLDWKTSPYEEESACRNCLDECEEADSDGEKICEIMRNPRSKDVARVPKMQKSLAQRFVRITIVVVVVIGRGFVAVGVGIIIEW